MRKAAAFSVPQFDVTTLLGLEKACSAITLKDRPCVGSADGFGQCFCKKPKLEPGWPRGRHGLKCPGVRSAVLAQGTLHVSERPSARSVQHEPSNCNRKFSFCNSLSFLGGATVLFPGTTGPPRGRKV